MKRQITGYCFILMFLYGISALMFGTLLPELMRTFALSLSKGGLIVTLQSLGGLTSAAVGILIGDKLKKGIAATVAFLLMGAMLIATGLSPGYVALLIIFLLSGLCLRVLDTMLNALIGDLHRARRGFYMNMLHLFFGIGAFAGPLIARWLLNVGISWRTVYLIVGGLYLLAGVPGLVLFKDGKNLVTGEGRRGAAPVRMGVPLVFLGMCLFAYVAHQSGVSAWFPHFFETDLGAGSDFSSLALSVYWIGIIVSRLLASRLSQRSSPVILITGGSATGAVLLLLGLAAANPSVLAAAAFGTGVLTGCTIPLCLVLAHDWYEDNTGSVTSMLAFFMLGGRLSAPWLMGVLGDAFGLGTSMYLSVLTLLLTAAAVAAAGLSRRRAVASI